jgi:hypothetical protein
LVALGRLDKVLSDYVDHQNDLVARHAGDAVAHAFKAVVTGLVEIVGLTSPLTPYYLGESDRTKAGGRLAAALRGAARYDLGERELKALLERPDEEPEQPEPAERACAVAMQAAE